MLLFAIGFNLWLYRLEPTAMIDPNDNTFQFALVDRTNQIWNYAQQRCASQKFSIVAPIKYSVLCTLDFVLLADHWVPNWAEGYNLPFYYSHIPQILIVGSYRLFDALSNFIRSPLALLQVLQGETLQKASQQSFSLFQYYHLVIYLLLSLFPLSVFLSLRLLRLPWLTAGIGALLATHLSTDGLYGLDPSSFLWRGYGLSSQLFAMIFLPLAIAYSWRYLIINNRASTIGVENGKLKIVKKNLSSILYSQPLSSINYYLSSSSFLPAVFFLFATTAGHLGIGIIALLSLPVLAFAKPLMMIFESEPLSHIFKVSKHEATKLLLLIGVTLFFLSYWIVPILLNNNYHNISFWDPIWKFNSYGWKDTMIRLFNGDLFDFGRLPILSTLIFIGIYASVRSGSWLHCYMATLKKNNVTMKQSNNAEEESTSQRSTDNYFVFGLLFIFWLLLYFGRTTWGGLIDLIPGMKEFHLSRFLVGLHVTGMFLAPLGLEAIVFRIMYYVLWLKEKFKISIIHTTYPIIHFFFTGILLIIILPPIYKQTITYNKLNTTLIKQANENFAKAKPDVDELFPTPRGWGAGLSPQPV